MKRRMFGILLAALCLLAGGCLPQGAGVSAPDESAAAPASKPEADLPEVPEMRAVWLSYVELDRLLSAAETVEAVQAALDAVMDDCAAYGLNAVIFHVRANSDAYYPSAYFPPAATAAVWLAQGFDPLGYAVQAAHARGLQLHAWVNPYRIGRDPANGRCADVFAKTVGGAATWYYVPSSLAVQKLILDGVRELLAYPIDGVQFDDYFYPTGQMSPLAEDFETDCPAEDAQGVAAWRRYQVDALIASVCAAVHRKADCVFGVSPSHDIQKTRDSMYADVGLWLARAGYVDYVCPQLYVGFENTSAGFAQTLADWAALPRHESVRLYIGLALYKTGLAEDVYAGDGRREWGENSDILSRAVKAVRAQPGCSGVMLYSYGYFDPTASRGGAHDAAVAEREIAGLLKVLNEQEELR